MSESTPNMLDYEETYRDFEMEVPEYFNFGFDVVDKWAEDRTKLALISLDPSGEHSRQHTFWDLKVQSNRFANVLKDLGVTKGARVFLMLPRIPEWYVAMLGLIKLGAVPMPATTLCTPSDIVCTGSTKPMPTWPSPTRRTLTSWLKLRVPVLPSSILL